MISSILQRSRHFLILCVLGTLCGEVSADNTTSERHSLVHSTPREQMRPLSTDRPDRTESPYSVDAGHLQVESDLLSISWLDEGDYHFREGVVLGMNCKVGLTDRIDLQMVFPVFSGESEWNDGSSNSSGKSRFPSFRTFESLLFRCKVNLCGNNSSGFAAAVMPYYGFGITTRTRDDHSIGIIAPVACPLNETYSMSAMGVLDQEQSGGVTSKAVQLSGSVSRDLSASLGMYVELFSEFREFVKPNVTFDTGITLGLSSNVQFDFGINWGFTDTAPDYAPFLGLSFRI